MKLARKTKLFTIAVLAVFVVVAAAFGIMSSIQQNAYAADMGVGLGFVKVYMEPIFPDGQNKLLSSDKTVTIRVYAINEALEKGVGVEGISYFIYWDQSVFENPVYSNEATTANGVADNLLTYDDHLEGTPTHGSSDFMGKDIKMFDVTFSVKDGVSLESNAKYTFRFAHEEDDIFEDQMVTTLNWDLAEDGLLDSEYNDLELTVAGVDSSLSALTVGGKAPTGGFTANSSTNQTVTFAEVPFSTTSVKIEATPTDSTATVSGAGTWNLTATGENTKEVTVTHGTQSTTYTLKINRAQNTVAQLSAISVKDGNTEYLTGFSATKKDYTITVPYATKSVTYTASAIDTATTTNASGSKTLNVGSNNTIEFNVTAQDDVTKDKYTVTITRTAASTVNTLSSLSVKYGTTELITAFSASTSEYTVTIPYKIEQLQIAATATDSLAQGVSGDVGTVACAKTESSKVLTITVTAESGDTQDYKVTVNRTPISSDATLKSLAIDGHTFTKDFDPTETRYDLSENVLPTVTSLVVRAELNFEDATLLINNDASLVSGSSITLQDGEGVIFVKVTAQNGAVKDYEIHYNKASASADNALKSLSVGNLTLMPSFDRFTYNYSLQPVENTVESLTISAAVNDSKASLAGLDGLVLENGSGEFALKVGTNEIKIRVTAENGSIQDYVISVTRLAAVNPEAPKLDALSVKAYGGDSELLVGDNLFDAGKTAYSLQVANAVGTVVIGATSSEHSVSGDVGNKPLSVGSNNFEIVVSNASGTTTYLITINRSAPLDTGALLQSLGVAGYEMIPAFSESIFNYTLTVPYATSSVTVSAEAKSPATLQTAVGSVNLDVGDNEIEIVVVAQAGNKNTYKIVVTRLPNDKETINTFTATLKDSTGKDLLGSPDTNGNYTVTLRQKIGILTLSVVADGNSAIAKIDNVGSGKTATLQISVASLQLYPSVNEYKITITPAQGSEKTCLLTIIVRDDLPIVDSLVTFVANSEEYEAVYDTVWNMYVVDFPNTASALTYTVKLQGFYYASILVGDRTWSVGESYTYNGAVTAVLLTVTMPDGTKNTYPIMMRSYASETPWIEFGSASDSQLEIEGITLRELLDSKTKVVVRTATVSKDTTTLTFKSNKLPSTAQLSVLYPNMSLTTQTAVDGLIWEFNISELMGGKNVIVFTVYDEDLLLNKTVVLEITKPQDPAGSASQGSNVGLIVALVLFIVIAVGASLVMVLFILKWRKATQSGKGHPSEE